MPKIIVPQLPEEKEGIRQELQNFQSNFQMSNIFNATLNQEGKTTEPEYENFLNADGGKTSVLRRLNSFLDNLKNDPEVDQLNLQALSNKLADFTTLGSEMSFNSVNDLTQEKLDQIGANFEKVLGNGEDQQSLSETLRAFNQASNFKYAEAPEMRAFIDIIGAVEKGKNAFEAIAIHAENQRFKERETKANGLAQGLRDYVNSANELDEQVAYNFPDYNLIGIRNDLIPKLQEGIETLDRNLIPEKENMLEKLQEELKAANDEGRRLEDKDPVLQSKKQMQQQEKESILAEKESRIKELNGYLSDIEKLESENKRLQEEVTVEDAGKAKQSREEKLKSLGDVYTQYSDLKKDNDDLMELMNMTANDSKNKHFMFALDQPDAELLKTQEGRTKLMEKGAENGMVHVYGTYVALADGFERLYNKYNPKPTEPQEPEKKGLLERIGLKKAQPKAPKYRSGEEVFSRLIDRSYGKDANQNILDNIKDGLTQLFTTSADKMVGFKAANKELNDILTAPEEDRADIKLESNKALVEQNNINISKLKNSVETVKGYINNRDQDAKNYDQKMADTDREIEDNQNKIKENATRKTQIKGSIVSTENDIRKMKADCKVLREQYTKAAAIGGKYLGIVEKRDTVVVGLQELRNTEPTSCIEDNRVQQAKDRAKALFDRASDCQGSHKNSKEFDEMTQLLDLFQKNKRTDDAQGRLDYIAKKAQDYLDAKNKQILPKIFGGSRLRHTRLNYAKEIIQWAKETKESLNIKPTGKVISEKEATLKNVPIEQIRDFSKDPIRNEERIQLAKEAKMAKEAEKVQNKEIENPEIKAPEKSAL